MGTFKDIRTRFEVALIKEAKKLTVWKQGMKDTYSVHRPDGRWVEPTDKNQIARIELDNDNQEEDIENFLAACKISPNEYDISSGSWSGKFDSWNITPNKDVDFFGKTLLKGTDYGIINVIDFTGGVKQVVGDKDLTPDSLDLPGKYPSIQSILAKTEAAIKAKLKDPNYQEFCLELMKAVQQQKQVFTKLDEIEGINKEFIIKYDFSKYVDLIDPKSVNAIAKDFGEVLGGIFMFNLVDEKGTGLAFPIESNLELVDFFFDKLQISSKAGKKGAKASAGGYISAIERAKEEMGWEFTPEESKVYNDILVQLKDDATKEPKNTTHLTRSRTSSTFSNCVNLFNIHLRSGTSWNYWLSSTGMNAGNINRDAIIQSFIDLKESGNLHKTLSKFLRITPIKTTKKSHPLLSKLLKARNEKQIAVVIDEIIKAELYDILIGTILYPCSKNLANVINTKYGKTLTSLINKALTVKQLYLALNIKKDQIKFTMKAMENSDFEVGSLNGVDSWKIKAMSISLV